MELALTRPALQGPCLQRVNNCRSSSSAPAPLPRAPHGFDARGPAWMLAPLPPSPSPFSAEASSSQAQTQTLDMGGQQRFLKYLDMKHILEVYKETQLTVSQESPTRVRLNYDMRNELRVCSTIQEMKRMIIRDLQVLNADTVSLAMAIIALKLGTDGNFHWQPDSMSTSRSSRSSKASSSSSSSSSSSGGGGDAGSGSSRRRKAVDRERESPHSEEGIGDADHPSTSSSPASSSAAAAGSGSAFPSWTRHLVVSRLAVGFMSPLSPLSRSDPSHAHLGPPSGAFSHSRALTEEVAPLVGRLLRRMCMELPNVSMTHAATALFCVGRMVPTPWPPGVYDDAVTLLAHIQPDLFVGRPYDLGRLAQGIAMMNVRSLPDAWMDEFCKVTQSKFFTMDSQKIALVAWGAIRAGHSPDILWAHAFYDAMERHMVAREGHLEQSLSLSLWAACRMRQAPSEDWVGIAGDAAESLFNSLAPSGFAAILHGLCRLSYRPTDAWMSSCVDYVVVHGERMRPREDGMVLSSLACWGFQPSESQLTAYLDQVLLRLHEYSADDLAQLLSALSRLQFLPQKEWLMMWLGCSRQQLRYCSPGGVAATLVSFAAWRLRPPAEYLKALYELELTFSRMSTLTVRQLAQSMRAMCALQQPPPKKWVLSMLVAFSEAVSPDPMATTDVSVVLFNLRPLLHMEADVAQDPAFAVAVGRILAVAQHLLPSMNGKQLHATVIGLASIKYPVSRDFLAAHAKSVSSRLTEISAPKKAAIGRSYFILRQAENEAKKKRQGVIAAEKDRQEGGNEEEG